MEQVIVGIVSLILVVVIYQERARRADAAALRRDMNEGFAALRAEFERDTVALRDELKGDIQELRKDIRELRGEIAATRQELKEEMSHGFARTDRRIDNLTTSVVALAETVGQVKGRTEFLATADR